MSRLAHWAQNTRRPCWVGRCRPWARGGISWHLPIAFDVMHFDDALGDRQAASGFTLPFGRGIIRLLVSDGRPGVAHGDERAHEVGFPLLRSATTNVEAGGLVSFGPSLAAMYRQTATIVVKILKGAKPADLPVEQPTKFDTCTQPPSELSVAFAIAFPPTLLPSDPPEPRLLPSRWQRPGPSHFPNYHSHLQSHCRRRRPASGERVAGSRLVPRRKILGTRLIQSRLERPTGWEFISSPPRCWTPNKRAFHSWSGHPI
jgi:hypothetical protein